MKRIYWLTIILLLTVLTAAAQTQQGVVKTRGRMVNGKHVAGKGLSGATVQVKGRSAVVSRQNGAFSFPVPSQSFMVQSVTKQGYRLVDDDATRKPYQHSANPIYLVMETPEQQTQDQLDAERKLRRTLQRQLQQREDEIEAMSVSLQEKQRMLQQLYQDQQNNEKLIADMAKQYAAMDYDQMDALNQRISDAILNGRLTEADSLLRSKGDMNDRIAEIRREQQAEAQEEADLAKRQENLAASKAGTQRKLEDAASDCYKFFDRFKLANQHDSAAYYIELRAALDTANADWQFEAGCYFHEQKQYQKVERYYARALSIYRRLAQQDSQAYQRGVAMTLNNLGDFFYNTQRFTESERMHKEALVIFMRLLKEHPQVYAYDVAQTLNNLAVLYDDTKRFAESEEMHNDALEIRRGLAQQDPHRYEFVLAQSLNNLGSLYYNTKRLPESEQMYKEALIIFQRLTQQNPQAFESTLATTLYNLATLYFETKRFKESETLYKEALEIQRRLAQQNPQTYEPDLTKMLSNLANLYSNTQRIKDSEAIYKEALEIQRRLAQQNPQVYESDLANTLHNLANLYSDTQRFMESEAMYQEALDIYHRLVQTKPRAYEPDVAQTQYNMGLLKVEQKLYTDAISFFENALNIYRPLAKVDSAQQQWYTSSLYYLSQLYPVVKKYSAAYRINKEWLPILKKMYEENPDEVRSNYAESVGNQSWYALFMKQYAESEQLAREGLAVDSTQHFIYSNLAAALLFQGKYAEAEKIYREYKSELKDSFLDDFRQLAETGVIPKEREADVERIKRMLNE